MIRRMWRTLAVLLLVAVCVLPAATALAQEQPASTDATAPSAPTQQQSTATTTTETANSALQVGPAIVERILTPGEPTVFVVQVKNVTNFPLPIKGFVRDMNPEASKLSAVDRERLDASEWFTITEPDFILQPNQERAVRVIVSAPRAVTPGGHYATIFFQPLVPEAALSPTTAYISARVGVLAFLVVKGDLKQELELMQPLQIPRLQRHGPVDLTFTIHNSGTVHMLPTGYVRVFDWRGREAAKMPIPPGVILPGMNKTYTLPWQTDDIVGTYTAELDAVYGDDQEVLASTSGRFWIVPWAEASVVLGIAITWLYVRRKTRRRWRKAWRAFNGR